MWLWLIWLSDSLGTTLSSTLCTRRSSASTEMQCNYEGKKSRLVVSRVTLPQNGQNHRPPTLPSCVSKALTARGVYCPCYFCCGCSGCIYGVRFNWQKGTGSIQLSPEMKKKLQYSVLNWNQKKEVIQRNRELNSNEPTEALRLAGYLSESQNTHHDVYGFRV